MCRIPLAYTFQMVIPNAYNSHQKSKTHTHWDTLLLLKTTCTWHLEWGLSDCVSILVTDGTTKHYCSFVVFFLFVFLVVKKDNKEIRGTKKKLFNLFLLLCHNQKRHCSHSKTNEAGEKTAKFSASRTLAKSVEVSQKK